MFIVWWVENNQTYRPKDAKVYEATLLTSFIARIVQSSVIKLMKWLSFSFFFLPKVSFIKDS